MKMTHFRDDHKVIVVSLKFSSCVSGVIGDLIIYSILREHKKPNMTIVVNREYLQPT